MNRQKLRSGGLKDWRYIWRLVARHRLTMLLLGVTSFAGASLEAVFLVLLTGAIMSLATGQSALIPVLTVSLPVATVVAICAVALAIRLVLGLLAAHLSALLVTNVTVEERRTLAEGFLRASWTVQQNEPSGRLQELMGNFVTRASSTATAVTQAITATLSLIAFLGTGIALDPLLTGGVVIALTILGGVLAPLRDRIRRLSARQARTGIVFANSIAEFAGLGQEMHAFGAQQHFLERIDALSGETARDARRVQTAQGQLTPIYTFLTYTAVLGGITAIWLLGAGDFAAIGAVMLLMLRSLSYAQQLLTVSGHFASSIPYLKDFSRMLDGYRSGRPQPGTVVPSRVTPITLSQVSFSYTADRTALEALDAQIERGDIVGVVGPSGAGKSTVAQLLLGLREPTSGLIRAGGIDLRQIDRAWWTSRVSFVPQDPVLFTGTVAENIRFFRDGITDDAMRKAAQQANVLEDILNLQYGFDTHLGERGGQLSGGQRQRLSIARALVGYPELLIMDEPTSALDGKSEALIRDTMRQLRGNVTMVVIAHRMSTLDICDRIMVIEKGRLTGFASPDVLHTKSSYYRRALAAAGIAVDPTANC